MMKYGLYSQFKQNKDNVCTFHFNSVQQMLVQPTKQGVDPVNQTSSRYMPPLSNLSHM
jgi:hypothetical protein